MLLKLLLPVIPIEAMAPVFMQVLSPLGTTALMRTLEIICLLTVLSFTPRGLSRAGISVATLPLGLRTGVVWSLVFAMVVAVSGGILLVNQINLLGLIASPLPVKGSALGLFLVTGVLIAPVAEEILFRGVLYAQLRELNRPVALILSTLIFAGFHYRGSGLPLFQVVGGVVFALSFEHSKSLGAPIIIHALGNLALFSISLYVFQP